MQGLQSGIDATRQGRLFQEIEGPRRHYILKMSRLQSVTDWFFSQIPRKRDFGIP